MRDLYIRTRSGFRRTSESSMWLLCTNCFFFFLDVTLEHCLQTARGNCLGCVHENGEQASNQDIMRARDEFESVHNRAHSHFRATEMSNNS